MDIIIDTNRYRDFCEGDLQAVAVFRNAGVIHVPFIVLAELRAGFAAGTRSSHNEIILNRFLMKARVRSLFPDEATTRHYAYLFKFLRDQGTPVPVSDLWIASLSVQHNLPLFTRDSHFDKLYQVPRVE